MQANGTPSVFLNEQHRMDPDIAEPPNHLSYLKHHISVSESARPFARLVKAINKRKFKRLSAAIMIDVMKGIIGRC
jgi:hypothetical protein